MIYMLKRLFNIYLFSLVLLSAFTGCRSAEKLSYFNNPDEIEIQTVDNKYQQTIQKDDLVSIVVYSKDPVLSAPFNMEQAPQTQIGGSSSQMNTSQPSTQKLARGFLVDANGDIDYPIFGKLKIAGMTTLELEAYIKDLIVSNGYIKDPLVVATVENFKVTILGEVSKPVVVPVNSERITIFEALASAGDVTLFGRRAQVKIVREQDGKRQVHQFSLKDPKLLESDFYYLKQNDLVYVETNNAKAFQSRVTIFWTLFLSGFSFLTSLIIFFVK